jgi:hypothetical protein
MKILDLILIVAISSILAASCQKQTSQSVPTQAPQHQAKAQQFAMNSEFGTVEIVPAWAKKQKWIFAGGILYAAFDIWAGDQYTYIEHEGEIDRYDLTGNYIGQVSTSEMNADVAQNTGTLEHYFPSSELAVTVDVNTPSIFYVERIRGSKGIAN